MNKILLLIVFLFAAPVLPAQEKLIPDVRTIYHQLGDGQATIKIFQYGNKQDIVFINLHSDERTSVAAANRYLQTTGGILIKLENNNQRNVRFSLDNNFYTFDPNRIFSPTGIALTLARFKNKSDKAVAEIQKFADHILLLIPQNPSCIIALHNNTNGELSVNSFLPGNVYETDAKKVYADSRRDPDDFFLTTDSLLFQQLSAEKYNTVWQDNQKVQQDGSLSVYFGEKNIRYLNCETEHGKTKQYQEMLAVALKYIGQRK